MYRLPNYLLFFALFCTAVHGFGQVDSGGIQEKHYQFLKKELQETRTFYTQEREAHRKFLESYYAYVSAAAAGLVLVFGAVIGFLNWRTVKDFKNQLNEKLAAQAEQLKAETNEAIRKAKTTYEKELRDIFMKDLSDFERQKEALLTILRSQIGAEDGRYLLVASEDKLKEMNQEGAELSYLNKTFRNFKTKPAVDPDKFSLSNVDALIYRTQLDDKSEDSYLRDTLLPHLNSQAEKIPLVVYARDGYIKGQTKEALEKYFLYQLATNPGTLIDNAASSVRVYRLLSKNNTSSKA